MAKVIKQAIDTTPDFIKSNRAVNYIGAAKGTGRVLRGAAVGAAGGAAVGVASSLANGGNGIDGAIQGGVRGGMLGGLATGAVMAGQKMYKGFGKTPRKIGNQYKNRIGPPTAKQAKAYDNAVRHKNINPNAYNSPIGPPTSRQARAYDEYADMSQQARQLTEQKAKYNSSRRRRGWGPTPSSTTSASTPTQNTTPVRGWGDVQRELSANKAANRRRLDAQARRQAEKNAWSRLKNRLETNRS